jgi:hypothetical protein
MNLDAAGAIDSVTGINRGMRHSGCEAGEKSDFDPATPALRPT